MDSTKIEVLKGILKKRDAIVYAAEVAWNLREWLKQVALDSSLQPVLQTLLPGVRRRLELRLIDEGLSAATSALPDGEQLTAASLIAFVERLEWELPEGVNFKLPWAAVKPPLPWDPWDTLSRKRAYRIAVQTIGKDHQPLWNADSDDDLDMIEQIDRHHLAELYAAIEDFAPLNYGPKTNDSTAEKPQWNDAGELTYGGALVRKVNGSAKNVRAVLAAFEEQGWPPRIDDPLPGGKNQQRLNETIRTMNEGLSQIRFRGDGSGSSYVWEAAD